MPFAHPHHAGWSLTPAGADVDGDGQDDLFAVAPQGSTDDDVAVGDPDATLPHLLLSGDLSALADLSDVVGYDPPPGARGSRTSMETPDGGPRPGGRLLLGHRARRPAPLTLDLGPDAVHLVAGDLDDGAADC